MPLPFVQALIPIPNLVVVQATAFTNAALGALARANTRVTFPLQPVARASSPRPMAGRASLALQAAASITQTTAGIVNTFIRINILQAAAVASSQVYDARRPKDYGQVTYGVTQLPSGVFRLAFPLSELGMPTLVAAGASWTSGPVDCLGLQHLTWGMKATQPIIMAFNRYVDPSCQSSIGAAVTATATANTALALDVNDGKGYSGFTLGFTNTAASAATLSSYSIMLESV